MSSMSRMIGLAAGLALSTTAMAQVWNEVGDAGQLPGTAQAVVGVGALTTINGTNDGADADMYQIMIKDFTNFRATTVGGTSFDTQLFLFNSAGLGVTFNDDSAASLQSTLTSAFLSGNGVYYLAVSRYDLDAVDAGSQEIWLDTPFGTERAPDGPGAANAVAGWSALFPPAAGGPYSITLNGASYVPAPGTLALLGMGGLLASRRRR